MCFCRCSPSVPPPGLWVYTRVPLRHGDTLPGRLPSPVGKTLFRFVRARPYRHDGIRVVKIVPHLRRFQRDSRRFPAENRHSVTTRAGPAFGFIAGRAGFDIGARPVHRATWRARPRHRSAADPTRAGAQGQAAPAPERLRSSCIVIRFHLVEDRRTRLAVALCATTASTWSRLRAQPSPITIR